MRKWKGRIPGLVITLVMAVVVAAFIAVLTWTQFIPVHLLVPAGVALVMLATAAALLVRNTAFKVQFVLGTLLALILTAVLAVGGYYLYRTTSTLSRISETRTQSTPVAVYVRAEDAAQSISDTAGYSFSILSTLDRTNTDAGLSEIESALGAAVPCRAAWRRSCHMPSSQATRLPRLVEPAAAIAAYIGSTSVRISGTESTVIAAIGICAMNGVRASS